MKNRALPVSGSIAVSLPFSERPRAPRGARTALLVGICSALLAFARADYRDDIGYTKLQAELGATLPTGAGVGVSQAEARTDSNTSPPHNYLPDTTLAEFAGKTFTAISGSGGISGHATTVAQYFFGSATSVAPGVTDIHSYEANHWLQSGFLNYGTDSAPNAETQKILNCSFVTLSPNAADVEILRRFDYAIQESGFLGVVGLNNGSPGNVPTLLASCYNGVSVGLTNGNHSYGTNTADGSGRTKPEIVAPSGATSFATPIVASAAAMLWQNGPASAAQPVTMKAILMAGATKSQFPAWSRSAAHPLDAIYGAGQVNAYNSYHILAATQQVSNTGATVAATGWDFGTTTGGSRFYFFDVPAGGASSHSAVLTWNRVIADTIAGPLWGSPSSSLADLTLKLYAASGFTTGSQLDASTSAVDNVEHIYAPALAPGRYALEVTADTAAIAYGLAWITVPNVTIAATTPMAAEFGAVPGTFTITRGGDPSAALTVDFAIGGTATNGTDYAAIPASVTIPAGAASAAITIAPLADNITEGDETVVLMLAADPAYGSGAQSSATVTIKDKPFDGWRFSKFTGTELADPSLSGDLADFEKDGIKNLAEYAFGLEPKTSDTTGLPVPFIQPGGALAIAFTRVKSATDITYLPEVSNDLTTWFSDSSSIVLLGTDDHGATETRKYGSLLPLDGSQRQFMRVRITRP